MKKAYEAPKAELIEFELAEAIMGDESGNLGGGVGTSGEGFGDYEGDLT